MNLPDAKQKGLLSPLFIAVISLLVIFGVVIFLLFNKISKLEKSTPLLKSEEEGVSFVYLKEVSYLKTGSEVCYEAGLSCLGMSSTRIIDSEDKFYGFITPKCDSQVKKVSQCSDLFETDYAVDKVEYVRSPNAESNQMLGADFFCLSDKEGKSGTFQYAYCVKKEE